MTALELLEALATDPWGSQLTELGWGEATSAEAMHLTHALQDYRDALVEYTRAWADPT